VYNTYAFLVIGLMVLQYTRYCYYYEIRQWVQGGSVANCM